VTLDDGKNGPAKDGTAIVQKLMFLTSGKSGYPIVIKNEFSSVVDPDAFEVVVRANQIASQDPSLAQDPISAYTKAYSQAEAAQAGPEDALFSWQYYRIGTQTNAMLEKLYGDDSLQQVDLNPVNPSSNWMSNLGLALAYTKSPTNDPLSWKDDQDRTNSTAITLTTYASWFGYPPRTIGGNFGGITTNFPGALEELKNFGPTLGSGRISDAEVQSLIQEAKKNISQQSSQ
jgi:hypothetical protein